MGQEGERLEVCVHAHVPNETLLMAKRTIHTLAYLRYLRYAEVRKETYSIQKETYSTRKRDLFHTKRDLVTIALYTLAYLHVKRGLREWQKRSIS